MTECKSPPCEQGRSYHVLEYVDTPTTRSNLNVQSGRASEYNPTESGQKH